MYQYHYLFLLEGVRMNTKRFTMSLMKHLWLRLSTYHLLIMPRNTKERMAQPNATLNSPIVHKGTMTYTSTHQLTLNQTRTWMNMVTLNQKVFNEQNTWEWTVARLVQHTTYKTRIKQTTNEDYKVLQMNEWTQRNQHTSNLILYNLQTIVDLQLSPTLNNKGLRFRMEALDSHVILERTELIRVTLEYIIPELSDDVENEMTWNLSNVLVVRWNGSKVKLLLYFIEQWYMNAHTLHRKR